MRSNKKFILWNTLKPGRCISVREEVGGWERKMGVWQITQGGVPHWWEVNFTVHIHSETLWLMRRASYLSVARLNCCTWNPFLINHVIMRHMFSSAVPVITSLHSLIVCTLCKLGLFVENMVQPYSQGVSKSSNKLKQYHPVEEEEDREEESSAFPSDLGLCQ